MQKSCSSSSIICILTVSFFVNSLTESIAAGDKDECQPDLIIKKEKPHSAAPGDPDRKSVDQVLSSLDTFALERKLSPGILHAGSSEWTEIRRFNGYGAKDESIELKEDRAFRQIAVLPGKNEIYAVSGSDGVYLINVTADHKGSLIEYLEPEKMQWLDRQGRKVNAPARLSVHAICYDSKRKRLVLSAWLADGKEHFLSYNTESKQIQLMQSFDSFAPGGFKCICLAYDPQKDRIFSVSSFNTISPSRIDEFSAQGALRASTLLKERIETGRFDRGLQLFVSGDKAVIFAPFVYRVSPIEKSVKSSKVYVYQLGSGELLLKKMLEGVQI